MRLIGQSSQPTDGSTTPADVIETSCPFSKYEIQFLQDQFDSFNLSEDYDISLYLNVYRVSHIQ